MIRCKPSLRCWQQHTDAFVVVKDETIVAKYYFNGMTAERHHLVNSVTKSFVAMLAGIAASRDLLDPDTLLAEYVAEFSQSKVAGNSGNGVRMKNNLNKKPRFFEAGMGNPGNVYSWTVETRRPEV